jgi:hypothetical protein
MKSDHFGLVSQINVKESVSWDRVFLTLDIDWAHDEVLEDTIELIRPFGAKVTWYATHPTLLLDEIRRVTDWQLGIHPNFNPLLEGKGGESATDIVQRLMSMVPEARSVRSHSIVQSSRLNQIFLSAGLTHDSNDYVPSHSGIELRPFKLEDGLIKVPYHFSDELWCLGRWPREDFDVLLRRPGMRVFDFHPIHVFLNTENLERYQATRALHRTPHELIKHRYDGFGTRDRLKQLLSSLNESSELG